MRDWVEWHQAYRDPNSYLSQRLLAVTAGVREALDRAAPGVIRLLSLCAGEGRDVIGAARGHPCATDIHGCLVELDPTLAARAERAVDEAALPLEVRRGDAGDVAVYADRGPVDVLLLVGVFGNITDDDVRMTISAVPILCRQRATVIWTRHRKAPDLSPTIREWFEEAGCEPVSFTSPGPESWSVGVERVMLPAPFAHVPQRLFTFVDDLPAR